LRLRSEKIVFNKPLELSDAIKALTALKEIVDVSEIKDNYLYVFVKENYDLYIETIPDIEVLWTAERLGITDRQAVVCLMEYPSFWDSLKDLLYLSKINNFNRYSVFTKNDLMGTGSRTWEEYIGESEEDAREFYEHILLIEDIVSIIKMDDEEEEGY
tara:strand:+ start:4557 stop:5030 length:474 start_codon:yes stop_codon:yes gene_type:complete